MSNFTVKLYNYGTSSMGSILVMNTYHECNEKLFLRQAPAANSALNSKYM
jgi:hypothetical protein